MDKLDPKSTALVLIDLQEGILGYPFAPRAADDVRAAGVRLANAFRAVGGLVVFTRVMFHSSFGDALRQPVDRPLPGSADLPANWGAFDSALEVGDADVVIDKQNWGAFYGTGLDLQLRRRGIDTIVLGGVATNMGVESTARDAYERNYALVFADEAISSMSAEMHGFAMETIFPLIGRIASVDAVVAAL